MREVWEGSLDEKERGEDIDSVLPVELLDLYLRNRLTPSKTGIVDYDINLDIRASRWDMRIPELLLGKCNNLPGPIFGSKIGFAG